MQRAEGNCPVCGRPCQGPVLCGDGEDRVEYIHTDLVEVSEYCVIYPNGDIEKVQEGVSDVGQAK